MSNPRPVDSDRTVAVGSTPTPLETREVGRLVDEVQFRTLMLHRAFEGVEVAVAAAVVEGGVTWAQIAAVVAPHRSEDSVRRDFADAVLRYRLEMDDVPLPDEPLRQVLGLVPVESS